MKKGFTLIELLVVVLIIGVLAAIALPMYQKTVLKSRFAALMPIGKAMADSNEAYYLEHGQYASNPQELPVQGQVEYPTGTQLEFGHNMDFAYVLVSNESARNNYIMYQKHSENYPGEIHCEAIEGDELAESVCASYSSHNIGTTLTEGYTTYVLQGGGNGISPIYAQALGSANCDKANNLGLECSITPNEDGSVSKTVCYSVDEPNDYCISANYSIDGKMTSRTSCVRYSAASNKCYVKKEAIYDENGRKISERICQYSNQSTGECSTWNGHGDEYRYDEYGNKIAERTCKTRDAQRNCTEYASGTEYEYQDGKLVAKRSCSSYEGETCKQWSSGIEYRYDPQTDKLSEKLDCSHYNTDNVCTYYSNYSVQYRPTANENQQEELQCVRASDGSCVLYIGNTLVTYDERGNKILERSCYSSQYVSESTGNCSRRTSATEYVYDDNNNLISQRGCNVDGTGQCSSYKNTSSYDYRYDEQGNMLSSRFCVNRNANTGECNSYRDSYFYTYDANGNRTSSTWCQNFDEQDNCTGTPSIYAYQYDENNNQIASKQCRALDEQNGCSEKLPVVTQYWLE